MSEKSTLATKQFGSGGIDLTLYSRKNPVGTRPIPRAYSNWQWHRDEVFVKINGDSHYLWLAVDHDGEVLEFHVTKPRGRNAALNS